MYIKSVLDGWGSDMDIVVPVFSRSINFILIVLSFL